MKLNDLKIILINPPSPFLINRSVFPPLGLLTLSAIFKQAGYTNIRFIDVIKETNIDDLKADIFFIYLATPNYDAVKEIVVRLRQKHNKLSKFIVGGPHATAAAEDCLWADAIVIGEGELASLRILKDFPNIRKFYYEELLPLDDIPFPDRDILDIKLYANNYKLRGVPTTTYITSRGCSWGKCAFCCKYWTENSHIRYRSAQNIIDEIKQVKEKYGINGAMFFDDEFVHNKKRLKEFCKLVAPLDIKWRCLSRVESLDEKTIKMMSESGCVEIAVGIESADQEILNNINKHIDIEQAKKVCKIIKLYDIDLKELFIVGLPGENRESLQKMDEFVAETEPFDIDATMLSVFPGSDIYDHPEKYDIKFNKKCRGWYKGIPGNYNSICKISTSKLTFEELVIARDEIEKRYKPSEKLIKKL